MNISSWQLVSDDIKYTWQSLSIVTFNLFKRKIFLLQEYDVGMWSYTMLIPL